MTAPPPPSSSYRPWEDTASSSTTTASPKLSSMQTSTSQTSYVNGRPSLPPLPMTAALVTDRRPVSGASVQGYSGQSSRKRRRLSDENEGFTLPSLTPNPQLPQRDATAAIAVGRRASDEGSSRSFRGGGGGVKERDGGRGREIMGREEKGSAYAGQSQNHYHLQSSTASRPGTPRGQQQQQQQQQLQTPSAPPPSNTLSVLVSSIHNLVLDLTASSQSPSYTIPAQITPHQIPSIETLTTYLETVFSLLLRLKSPTSQSPLLPPPPLPPQQQAQSQQPQSYPSSSTNQPPSTLQQTHAALQKTHKTLQAAHTRSQARAATLEKKLLVCTDETEALTNERERLQGMVESLEESLTEVREERDEIRLELRKSGAQWGRILVNAGKLAEGAGRVEKGLRGEVEGLKEEVALLRGRGSDGDLIMSGMDCAGVSGSRGGEREVRELKLRVRELERNVEDARRDGRGVLEFAEKLAKIGRGIVER
ncbi:hypothetical protein L873DRAFT_1821025 [Choiromyces venosus 120613-1]|uniref:Uncharacterized protein n=1 Tax=Choiromyces venosus 120613-1 TaxID=1336337 RepID=A0A3N4IX98_9PEZI|nr:hypothetical protein L873DRAFT_1821025 [Choiromyces venosus 120613-1]